MRPPPETTYMMAWPPKRAWRTGPAGERGAGWRSVRYKRTVSLHVRAPGGFYDALGVLAFQSVYFSIDIAVASKFTR